MGGVQSYCSESIMCYKRSFGYEEELIKESLPNLVYIRQISPRTSDKFKTSTKNRSYDRSSNMSTVRTRITNSQQECIFKLESGIDSINASMQNDKYQNNQVLNLKKCSIGLISKSSRSNKTSSYIDSVIKIQRAFRKYSSKISKSYNETIFSMNSINKNINDQIKSHYSTWMSFNKNTPNSPIKSSFASKNNRGSRFLRQKNLRFSPAKPVKEEILKCKFYHCDLSNLKDTFSYFSKDIQSREEINPIDLKFGIKAYENGSITKGIFYKKALNFLGYYTDQLNNTFKGIDYLFRRIQG